MKKLVEFFAGTLVAVLVLFVAWVFLAGAPDERIDRACRPTVWVGKVFSSASMAADTDYSGGISSGFSNFDKGCQLTIWDYFYAQKWCLSHPGELIPGDQYDRCPVAKNQEGR